MSTQNKVKSNSKDKRRLSTLEKDLKELRYIECYCVESVNQIKSLSFGEVKLKESNQRKLNILKTVQRVLKKANRVSSDVFKSINKLEYKPFMYFKTISDTFPYGKGYSILDIVLKNEMEDCTERVLLKEYDKYKDLYKKYEDISLVIKEFVESQEESILSQTRDSQEKTQYEQMVKLNNIFTNEVNELFDKMLQYEYKSNSRSLQLKQEMSELLGSTNNVLTYQTNVLFQYNGGSLLTELEKVKAYEFILETYRHLEKLAKFTESEKQMDYNLILRVDQLRQITKLR